MLERSLLFFTSVFEINCVQAYVQYGSKNDSPSFIIIKRRGLAGKGKLAFYLELHVWIYGFSANAL